MMRRGEGYSVVGSDPRSKASTSPRGPGDGWVV